jgi:hypothetical protein
MHTLSPRTNTMPGLSRFIAVSVALLLGLATPVYAQGLEQSTPAPVDAAMPDVGPTLGSATSGIHANTAHEDLTAAEAAHRAASGGHTGLSKGAIILIVGGAALAAGVLIGGTGGTALAIGGALVALYGLYLILQ